MNPAGDIDSRAPHPFDRQSRGQTKKESETNIGQNKDTFSKESWGGGRRETKQEEVEETALHEEEEERLFCRSWPVRKSWPLTSKFWRTLDDWLLRSVGLSMSNSIKLDVAPLDGFNGTTRVANGPAVGIFNVGAFNRLGFESSAGPRLQRLSACCEAKKDAATVSRGLLSFTTGGRHSINFGGPPTSFGRSLCCNSLTRTHWSVSVNVEPVFLDRKRGGREKKKGGNWGWMVQSSLNRTLISYCIGSMGKHSKSKPLKSSDGSNSGKSSLSFIDM